jgi:hypothetical protein
MIVGLLGLASLSAQVPGEDRVVAALFDAIKPALPYPEADEHDLPVNGSTTTLWVVRRPAPDQPRIEIIANPLNADNQARANKAEVEIQRAVMAAQQKAQALYERAVAEFERTGRTDPIDGITLGDEGVAGERFDASNRVVITWASNQKAYRLRVDSSIEPVVSSIPQASIVRVAAHVFSAAPSPKEPAVSHYHASEVHLLFGGSGPPAIIRTGPTAFDIAAAAGGGSSVMVSVRGNESLVEQIASRSNWATVAAAIAP